MRVRLTTDRVGDRWIQHSGDEIDLPREEALALIRADQAEQLEPEMAHVAALVENADESEPRKRGRRRK